MLAFRSARADFLLAISRADAIKTFYRPFKQKQSVSPAASYFLCGAKESSQRKALPRQINQGNLLLPVFSDSPIHGSVGKRRTSLCATLRVWKENGFFSKNQAKAWATDRANKYSSTVRINAAPVCFFLGATLNKPPFQRRYDIHRLTKPESGLNSSLKIEIKMDPGFRRDDGSSLFSVALAPRRLSVARSCKA